MNTDKNLWMGNIEPWMTESFIMKSFKYYNVNPIDIKFIKDRETNINKNYCFITFNSTQEANNILIALNGKSMPGTSIKFKLNWANYYSTFNKNIYVGNLNNNVSDIVLYHLFKNKYSSVHHASIFRDKGKAKGFGIVSFRKEEDYEKCLKEMDGIEFHGNIIKLKGQMKKEDNNSNNNYNKYNEEQNNYMMNNINTNLSDNFNINNFLSKNLDQDDNNNINSIKGIKNNNGMSHNLNLTNSNSINTKVLNNMKSNTVNINNNIIDNKNTLDNFDNLNNTHNKNFYCTNNNNNNLSNILNNNFNSNIFKNDNNQNINLNNFISSYQKKEINSQNNNNNFFQNDINNNIFLIGNRSTLPNKNTTKKNNCKDYKLEILNRYNDTTLIEKIHDNLDRLYNYYTNIYPGDITKLKCKLIIN